MYSFELKLKCMLRDYQIMLDTLFFYDKIFLSAENPETVRFYSPYQQDHDINYTTVQEIKTSTARRQ